MTEREMMEALRAPFPAKDIQWRVGSVRRDGTAAMALAYLTSRAAMDRLDEVVGPINWQDTYREWRTKGVMCGIGIRGEDGEWSWKYDAADETQIEPTKGGIADAFKRAAVKWGIGRYLYNLDTQWTAVEKRGNTTVLKSTPTLPAWALPGGKLATTTQPKGPVPKKALDPGALAEAVAQDAETSVQGTQAAFCAMIARKYGYYETPADVIRVAKELGLNYSRAREDDLEHKLLEYAEYPGDGG